MGKERSTDRPLRGRATGLFVLLGSLLALGVVPAFAAAATFSVTGTGDGSAGAGVSCPAVAGKECTLRAADPHAANGAAGPDTITFDPAVFNGQAGDTILAGGSAGGQHPDDDRREQLQWRFRGLLPERRKLQRAATVAPVGRRDEGRAPFADRSFRNGRDQGIGLGRRWSRRRNPRQHDLAADPRHDDGDRSPARSRRVT